MRAFCTDVHISVIADFKSAFPDIEVIDWCLSGHAWVMNRPQDTPRHINAHTWQNINDQMISQFQQEYDFFLKTFDFFIVGYASCFAMIFEKYNKPILLLNAVRYDVPFCWNKNVSMLEKYKQCLNRLNREHRLIAVSNNKADQLYLEKGCGILSKYIPSLCLYTNTTYSPTNDTFLAYTKGIPDHPLITQRSSLPPHHKWSDVTSFKGVVAIPYEISLMSLFEHFTAGCPLFFPSKAYMKTHPAIQSMSAYWGESVPVELVAFRDLNLWIDLADMYDAFVSPNTYYFDSIHHLHQLLRDFVYVDDRSERETRKQQILTTWRETLLTHRLL